MVRAVQAEERAADLAEAYLDLLESLLTGLLLEDDPVVTEGSAAFLEGMTRLMYGGAEPPQEDLGKFTRQVREAGWDYPSRAWTMVGLRRLRNFRELIGRAIAGGVPGDILEAGVWRGGASIMARAVLRAHGEAGRRVILADSFEGLPPPNPGVIQDAGSKLHHDDILAASLDTVRQNFRRFGLLDDRVVFLKGWFRDTLPTAPVERLAVLRLDGDMYESTLDPLQFLYDKVSPGGFVIVDDYFFAPCRTAVHDFLDRRGLKPKIEPIDGMGVYFQVT